MATQTKQQEIDALKDKVRDLEALVDNIHFDFLEAQAECNAFAGMISALEADVDKAHRTIAWASALSLAIQSYPAVGSSDNLADLISTLSGTLAQFVIDIGDLDLDFSQVQFGDLNTDDPCDDPDCDCHDGDRATESELNFSEDCDCHDAALEDAKKYVQNMPEDIFSRELQGDTK